MSFSALYTADDADPVEGDGIATNTGYLNWTNTVLAHAESHPELAHLAAHGWADDFDALEHELSEFLHAVPDPNVASVTASVLAAVKARPPEAAALLVTDGEPSGEEDDEGGRRGARQQARLTPPA